MILFLSKSYAQIDTSFWFAAPDISSAFGYDQPVNLVVTSFQFPCNITVSIPANGAVVPQTILLAANTTQSIDLTSWLSNLECGPGNLIQNNGLKVVSDNKIAAYYSVSVDGPNPEFFSLKGINALGTSFYISSQYILNNGNEYTPQPFSSFNIVATEDNTLVTILPSNNIVGHTAGTIFSITLNRGQTYAAIATSQAAALHLQGSSVTATKPIAITLADDLLNGGVFTNTCRDLAGDQTVPISVLGTEYIAIRSNLNAPYDKLYITAVQNGTSLTQDGVFVTTLNASQSFELTINGPVTYVQLSKPAYAYQLSGYGCEVGSAILPKINCTGSPSVSVARTTTEDFSVCLLVKTGGEGNFLLNDNAGIITASNFTVVPGTTGQWHYAKIPLSLSSYPYGSVIKISNSSTLFQEGVLSGSTFGNGFGYFSNFNTLLANAYTTNTTICVGENIQLFADSIPSAIYSWTGPAGFFTNTQNPSLNNINLSNSGNYILTVNVPDCGIYKDTVAIHINTPVLTTINQSICEGQSYLGYNLTGTYVDIFVAANGCDSTRTLNLVVKPKSFTTYNQVICDGQSYQGHTTSGTYITTLIAANGCDSIITLNLTVKPRSFTTNNQTICEGQTYQGYTITGTYTTILSAANGCDSIVTLNLTVKPKSYSTINQSICQGQSFEGYTLSGTYVDILIGANGCDSIRTINLVVKPKSFTTYNQVICDGQSYQGHTTSGTYITTLVAANGCDSVVTLNLTVKPRSFTTINQTICEGQTYQGYTTTGTYTTILSAANGCDSIVTLNLTVKPKSYSTINQSICQGQSFEGYTLSGTYVDILIGANGCDSIRTINLLVNLNSNSTINQTICEGQSYGGHDVSGTYVDILIAANGCDSLRTLNLTVKPRSYSSVLQFICQGQSFEGYSTTGIFFDTLVASNGCDSIRTLDLIVYPVIQTIIDYAICSGQSYAGYSIAGSYIDTLQTINGCDSIRRLNLKVDQLPVPELGPNKTICLGENLILMPGNFSSYLWQDGSIQNTYNVLADGLYVVKVTNSCGSASDSANIEVEICNIIFPSAFTPNADGKNDIFRALDAFAIQNYQLTIFNRWGEKVFESTNLLHGWDGKYKNVPADAGTYVWTCNYKAGIKSGKLKGYVMLIR